MIRFGRDEKFYEIIEEIKSNDRIFYKVFNALKNDDLSEAVKFIRDRHGISMSDAKIAIMDAKGTFSDIQITKLLAYIYENEPEYVI